MTTAIRLECLQIAADIGGSDDEIMERMLRFSTSVIEGRMVSGSEFACEETEQVLEAKVLHLVGSPVKIVGILSEGSSVVVPSAKYVAEKPQFDAAHDKNSRFIEATHPSETAYNHDRS